MNPYYAVVMRTKKQCEKAARTSISMPPELMRFASRDASQMSFASFSDYIQWLIRSRTPKPNAS